MEQDVIPALVWGGASFAAVFGGSWGVSALRARRKQEPETQETSAGNVYMMPLERLRAAHPELAATEERENPMTDDNQTPVKLVPTLQQPPSVVRVEPAKLLAHDGTVIPSGAVLSIAGTDDGRVVKVVNSVPSADAAVLVEETFEADAGVLTYNGKPVRVQPEKVHLELSRAEADRLLALYNSNLSSNTEE